MELLWTVPKINTAIIVLTCDSNKGDEFPTLKYLLLVVPISDYHTRLSIPLMAETGTEHTPQSIEKLWPSISLWGMMGIAVHI